jgi:hypothetical protein
MDCGYIYSNGEYAGMRGVEEKNERDSAKSGHDEEVAVANSNDTTGISVASNLSYNEFNEHPFVRSSEIPKPE